MRILVKDTGVGIPAQDIDKVKTKFFKSNKTVRGSGIGLAVADEIIKQHHGLLFLESTEGVGTTVTIVLPLYEKPTEPVEDADAIRIDELASNSITTADQEIVVDNDEDNRANGGLSGEFSEQTGEKPDEQLIKNAENNFKEQ